MLVEAKRFLPRAVLVPFLAAGAMLLESVVNTPVAEAGGCNSEMVITSQDTPLEMFSKLEEECKQSALRNRAYITQQNQENQVARNQVRDDLATAALFAASFLLSSRFFKRLTP